MGSTIGYGTDANKKFLYGQCRSFQIHNTLYDYSTFSTYVHELFGWLLRYLLDNSQEAVFTFTSISMESTMSLSLLSVRTSSYILNNLRNIFFWGGGHPLEYVFISLVYLIVICNVF
jgi:hypothetical protein